MSITFNSFCQLPSVIRWNIYLKNEANTSMLIPFPFFFIHGRYRFFLNLNFLVERVFCLFFFLVVTVIHVFSDVETRIILIIRLFPPIIIILFTFKAANDLVFVLDTDHLYNWSLPSLTHYPCLIVHLGPSQVAAWSDFADIFLTFFLSVLRY